MPVSRGLKKLFYNVSIASRKIEERRAERDKLRGYLRKIKIVASKSAKKSVIHDEVARLESHISDMLDKKLVYVRAGANAEALDKVKQKESELNDKIEKLNELLAKVGKKVDEGTLLKQLEEEKPDLVDELEEKLYSLEAKYNEMIESPNYPKEALDKVKDKISMLKEKVRELKNR